MAGLVPRPCPTGWRSGCRAGRGTRPATKADTLAGWLTSLEVGDSNRDASLVGRALLRQVSFLDHALRGGVAVVGQVEVRDLPRRRTRWPGGPPLWRWGTRIATRVSWGARYCGRSRSSTVPYEGRSAGLQQSMAGLVPRPCPTGWRSGCRAGRGTRPATKANTLAGWPTSLEVEDSNRDASLVGRGCLRQVSFLDHALRRA